MISHQMSPSPCVGVPFDTKKPSGLARWAVIVDQYGTDYWFNVRSQGSRSGYRLQNKWGILFHFMRISNMDPEAEFVMIYSFIIGLT